MSENEWEHNWKQPWPFWRPYCWINGHDWYEFDYLLNNDYQCLRCGKYVEELEETNE